MTILEAIILGITQGATEFIPVSSSGHVFIVYRLLGIEPEGQDVNVFNAFLHLGTIFAVVIYYRKLLWTYAQSFFQFLLTPRELSHQDTNNLKIIALLVVSTIPIGIAGVLFDTYVQEIYNEDSLRPVVFTSAALTTLGIFYLFVPSLLPQKRIKYKKIGITQAVIIGIGQTFALFYGISRSGMSIISAEFARLKRKDALDYVFLLSIPVISGAVVYELLTIENFSVVAEEWDVITVGIITSFISGYIAIAFLLKFLKTQTFRPFGIYLIIIGLMSLWLLG